MFAVITNNKLPVIPEECTNSYIVFHILNEKIVRTPDDIYFGLISNIAPNWWTDLVLFLNTEKESYLQSAKTYIGNKPTVFFPELMLNLEQQRNINNILNLLDYSGNILIKTNSPFIIQSCSSIVLPKKMFYLGSFKN